MCNARKPKIIAVSLYSARCKHVVGVQATVPKSADSAGTYWERLGACACVSLFVCVFRVSVRVQTCGKLAPFVESRVASGRVSVGREQ